MSFGGQLHRCGVIALLRFSIFLLMVRDLLLQLTSALIALSFSRVELLLTPFDLPLNLIQLNVALFELLMGLLEFNLTVVQLTVLLFEGGFLLLQTLRLARPIGTIRKKGLWEE